MNNEDTEFEKCKKQCASLRAQVDQQRQKVKTNILKSESNTEQIDRLPNIEFEVVKKFEKHYGKIYALYWSYDSNMLLSASQDGTMLIWDASTTKKKLAIKLQSSWVMSVTYSPSDKYIACGGIDNLCTIYDIKDKSGWNDNMKPYRELQKHEGYISCVRFLNDEKIISSSGDSTCILWDIEKKLAQSTFLEHKGDVMRVAVCQSKEQNRQWFVSCSVDTTIKAWDIRTSNCVGNFEGHVSDVNAVEWFPDSYAFASGSDDSTCRLYDTRAYRQINEYSNENIASGVTSVSFSNSGRILFSGYDDEPFCLGWDVSHGDSIAQLQHSQMVSNVMVSPNGQTICTSSWDKILRLWTVK